MSKAQGLCAKGGTPSITTEAQAAVNTKRADEIVLIGFMEFMVTLEGIYVARPKVEVDLPCLVYRESAARLRCIPDIACNLASTHFLEKASPGKKQSIPSYSLILYSSLQLTRVKWIHASYIVLAPRRHSLSYWRPYAFQYVVQIAGTVSSPWFRMKLKTWNQYSDGIGRLSSSTWRVHGICFLTDLLCSYQPCSIDVPG